MKKDSTGSTVPTTLINQEGGHPFTMDRLCIHTPENLHCLTEMTPS